MGKPQRITKIMVPGDGTVINRKNTVVGASVIGDYVDANGFRVLVFERPEPQQAPKPKPQAAKRTRRTQAQVEAYARQAQANAAAQGVKVGRTIATESLTEVSSGT